MKGTMSEREESEPAQRVTWGSAWPMVLEREVLEQREQRNSQDIKDGEFSSSTAMLLRKTVALTKLS